MSRVKLSEVGPSGFLLAIDLSNFYQSGMRWDPRWFATFFALMVGGSVLISLGWWYWQERKY